MVAERPFAPRWALAASMAGAVGVVSLGVFASLSKGFKHRIRWSLGVTSIAVLVLFQWPIFAFGGSTVGRAVPLPLVTDAIPVVLAATFLWTAVRLAGERLFAVLVGIGTLLIVGSLLASILPYVERTPTPVRGIAGQAALPDVLLVVLDAYTRADVLDDQFGFDNTVFLGELEQLGFTVAHEARSNYSLTYASISSMLDMNYVFDLGPITAEETSAMTNALSGDAAMFSQFREAGYEVAYVENAWEGSACGASADICVREGLVERTLWNLGQLTILAPLLKEARPNPFNTLSLEHLELLPEIVSQGRTESVPRLTIAHIILPHPPFLLTSECDRINSAARRKLSAASDLPTSRGFYIGQLECTNNTLIRSLRQIIGSRGDTIVMVTGDHGTAFNLLGDVPVDNWPYEGVRERMTILSAYRVPGCENVIYPSITPVNGTRAITSCATGTNLAPLPDNSFLSPVNLSGSVTDLGHRLDN